MQQAQQYGVQQPCTEINGDNYGGNLVNAVYQVSPEGGKSSLIGNVAYVDENSDLHPYPESNIQLTNQYTKIQNYNSSGNDLSGKMKSNVSVDDCQNICNNDFNCYGVVFDNSNNVCYPKNKSMYPAGQRQPYNGYDLYIRNKSPLNPPLGVDGSVQNIDSITYQNYTSDGSNPTNAYGLHQINSTQKQQLQHIQSTLKSLSQQIIHQTGSFNENDLLVNTQTQSNMNSVNQYLDELKDVDHAILQMTSNSTGILNDSDIVVLQENYNYLFWSTLAVGLTLITMSVSK